MIRQRKPRPYFPFTGRRGFQTHNDMAVADERDVSTVRIFTVLCIASALFWGGVGLVLYAMI